MSFVVTLRFLLQDPGDLAIEAGARVFVTDKSSDDWSGFFFHSNVAVSDLGCLQVDRSDGGKTWSFPCIICEAPVMSGLEDPLI